MKSCKGSSSGSAPVCLVMSALALAELSFTGAVSTAPPGATAVAPASSEASTLSNTVWIAVGTAGVVLFLVANFFLLVKYCRQQKNLTLLPYLPQDEVMEDPPAPPEKAMAAFNKTFGDTADVGLSSHQAGDKDTLIRHWVVATIISGALLVAASLMPQSLRMRYVDLDTARGKTKRQGKGGKRGQSRAFSFFKSLGNRYEVPERPGALANRSSALYGNADDLCSASPSESTYEELPYGSRRGMTGHNSKGGHNHYPGVRRDLRQSILQRMAGSVSAFGGRGGKTRYALNANPGGYGGRNFRALSSTSELSRVNITSDSLPPPPAPFVKDNSKTYINNTPVDVGAMEGDLKYTNTFHRPSACSSNPGEFAMETNMSMCTATTDPEDVYGNEYGELPPPPATIVTAGSTMEQDDVYGNDMYDMSGASQPVSTVTTMTDEDLYGDLDILPRVTEKDEDVYGNDLYQ